MNTRTLHPTLFHIEKELFSITTRDKRRRAELMQEWLRKQNVSYLTGNEGIHIRIEGYKKEINLWPTTCKMHFIANGSQRTREVYVGMELIITTLKSYLFCEDNKDD
jgi:hypothetical protein